MFQPMNDPCCCSLEDTYVAPRRAFRMLGIDKLLIQGLFYALIVNSILKCSIDAGAFEGVGSKLQSVLKDARSLLDFYYSIGGLVLIKGYVPNVFDNFSENMVVDGSTNNLGWWDKVDVFLLAIFLISKASYENVAKMSVHCPYLELHATEFLLHREFDATMPTVAPLFDVGICVGYMICSLPHGYYASRLAMKMLKRCLEDTYEAPRRAFRILGIDKTADTSPATCPLIAETLASQSSKAKGLFYALIVNSILRCSIDARAFEGFGSKLQSVLKDARSLLDCYYSIGGLVLIKSRISPPECNKSSLQSHRTATPLRPPSSSLQP
ncbi:hypothetical protein MRB53_015464 [Persea americana]|uniref:Uncharacterized protein n=1 Tax=Persea americana TaxID=3435 RepID=A0ACC2LZF8_PERAE|nr:hypothetical protein MRB53_015464 [Persea americana]